MVVHMSYFEATVFDWNLFEETFNISRSNVVEVNNVFRYICRLYVHKNDVQLWNNRDYLDNKTELIYYELMHGNKWYRNAYKCSNV